MSEQTQPQFSSPFARGVKGRGLDNPSFKSNDIFYGRDPAPKQQSANRRTNNPISNNNYINSTPDKLAKKLDYGQPELNVQDTVKKQPNYVQDNSQLTAKKQQQQQQQSHLENTRIPSNSYLNDTTQEQVKPKQLYQQQKQQSHNRSKTGNIPYPSKYTEVNPDQNRYELPVRQQQNYVSNSQQQLQEQSQKQSQDAKEITFKPSRTDRPASSQQNYLRSYTPQKFVRIDGKLVAQDDQSYAPTQTARFQKEQPTPKSLSRATSQPFINQDNDDVKSQASRYSKRSQNSQGIRSILGGQEKQQGSAAVPNDRASVASSKAKSIVSGASCCSHISVGSVYVCDVCYNKALKMQKEEQKKQQKQRDIDLHNWRVEQDKIYSQCVQDAQNSLKQELNQDMTDFFKEHPNKLEKIKRNHQKNIDTNQKVVQFSSEQAQRHYAEQQELDQQKKDYMKQVLTEQMEQKKAKKEQEKQDDLRYAYNGEFDEMMRRKEQQRQANLTNQMKKDLQKQIDIKNERKIKDKQRDQEYNQIYNQLQKNARDSQDKMQKEQNHQKQLYKQMLEDAIQNKLDKTQQQRVNELTKLRDELRKIEDQNKKIAQEVYSRDQQMKQELRDSYKEQIGIKKDKLQKEKNDRNYITTLPIQERPKLDTKECNECHSQVILNRLMKYKKNLKK